MCVFQAEQHVKQQSQQQPIMCNQTYHLISRDHGVIIVPQSSIYGMKK